MRNKCPECDGSGLIPKTDIRMHTCPNCNGSGWATVIEKPAPPGTKKTLLERINEPIGHTPYANLTFEKIVGLFFGGLVLIMLLCFVFGALFDSGSQPSRDAGADEIARKLANGEELNALEKKVVKEWEEQGKKNSK